jgi:hypothetical protein
VPGAAHFDRHTLSIGAPHSTLRRTDSPRSDITRTAAGLSQDAGGDGGGEGEGQPRHHIASSNIACPPPSSPPSPPTPPLLTLAPAALRRPRYRRPPTPTLASQVTEAKKKLLEAKTKAMEMKAKVMQGVTPAQMRADRKAMYEMVCKQVRVLLPSHTLGLTLGPEPVV